MATNIALLFFFCHEKIISWQEIGYR